MLKLLHIQASPRAESYSTRVAEALLEEYRRLHPRDQIETLDVFESGLPQFEAPAAAAKYAVLAGQAPHSRAGRAWKKVIKTIEQFSSADKVVISSAMWNFSIPYRLKQYLDVIVQPGLTFKYSAEKGYEGLVTGRPAVLILARGGAYGGEGAAFDFQKPYLRAILGFIGFADIREVIIEPTLQAGPAVAEEKARQAEKLARKLAAEI